MKLHLFLQTLRKPFQNHAQAEITMANHSKHVMSDMQNEIAAKLDQLLAPALIEIKANEKALKSEVEKGL
jgi:NADH dehydrogenase FAD-containing subunit